MENRPDWIIVGCWLVPIVVIGYVVYLLQVGIVIR
jgi:hypothetical protein